MILIPTWEYFSQKKLFGISCLFFESSHCPMKILFIVDEYTTTITVYNGNFRFNVKAVKAKFITIYQHRKHRHGPAGNRFTAPSCFDQDTVLIWFHVQFHQFKSFTRTSALDNPLKTVYHIFITRSQDLLRLLEMSKTSNLKSASRRPAESWASVSSCVIAESTHEPPIVPDRYKFKLSFVINVLVWSWLYTINPLATTYTKFLAK